MIVSHEILKTLTESDLRTKVLIPLFQAMGFRDVSEHHGTDEFGKDIVMWMPDVNRDRINHCCVVKAVKINSSNRLEVIDQINQCFGKDFTDPVAGTSENTDRVLVVSSQAITMPARKAIRAHLRPGKLDRYVDFIDGTVLAERVSKYLAKELLWDALAQAQSVLQQSFGVQEVGLAVFPDGTKTAFLGSPAEPFKGAADLTLSVQKREEWFRHLRHGTPIEFEGASVRLKELPDAMESLSGAVSIESMKLGAARVDPPVICSLHFVGSRGTSVTFGYVDFSWAHGGSDSGTLLNLSQPIPERWSLRIGRRSGIESTLNMARDPDAPMCAVSYERSVRLAKVFGEGGYVEVIDAVAETPLAQLDFTAKPNHPAVEDELGFAAALAAIQRKTGTRIDVPSRQFSAEEVQQVFRAATIVEDGVLRVTTGTATAKLRDLPGSANLEGKARIVDFQAAELIRVLDSAIDVGPYHWKYEGRLSRVSRDGSEATVEVSASEETPFIFVYPRWTPGAGASESNREEAKNAQGNHP